MRSPATLLMLCLAAGAAPAAADPQHPDEVSADYAVRWLGIEVGRLSTELRRTGERFHLAYQARTTGPLRWVVDFRSDGWASGRLDEAGATAEHFRGRSFWNDNERFWRVGFGADGAVTELELDAATRADREPVPERLRRGPDPLTLGLEALVAAATGATLEGQSFDGRRAMTFSLDCASRMAVIRPVALEVGALDAEAREALACAADGELLAGRSKKWGDEVDAAATEKRPPARVWLVPEVGGLPHWPVRIEAESKWGAVTVELERLVGAGP